MPTQVQMRGAATATQAARTLAVREIDFDTTLKRLNYHDGATAGGIPHANYADIQNQTWTYAAATGTDSIAITLAIAPASYAAGQKFAFKAQNTNTGSATLNVNSLGAKTIKKVANGALETLAEGDIVQNAIYEVTYDGTDMLLTGAGGGGSQWVMVDEVVPSGTAFQVDWSNGADYDAYEIIFDRVGGCITGARVNVATAANSSSIYRTARYGDDPGATGTDRIVISGSGLCSGVLRMYPATSPKYLPTIEWAVGNSTNNYSGSSIVGANLAVDGLSFFRATAAGTFTAGGKITIMGRLTG